MIIYGKSARQSLTRFVAVKEVYWYSKFRTVRIIGGDSRTAGAARAVP